jgi:CRISPR-associated exonuclease Cas4
MTRLQDEVARARSLTDLDSTLLVEAAAGTGKTALIAGRVVVLLTRHIHPANIAAITYTEPAASQLASRVQEYASGLLAGKVPKALHVAFPNGLDEAQEAALTTGMANLDALTAVTIHSFCQKIILAYAVEADIDPGAQIIDKDSRDAVYSGIVNRWLRRRLDTVTDKGDPVSVISRANPRGVVAEIQSLAKYRLEHRRAVVPPANVVGRPDQDLITAVSEFGAWLRKYSHPGEAEELFKNLTEVAEFYRDSLVDEPSFSHLWTLAHPSHFSAMKPGKKSTDLKAPRMKGVWKEFAGDARGAQLNEEMMGHFETISGAYRNLRSKISAAVLAGIDNELAEILRDYDDYRRSAAVLDFDDLITKAHALIEGHDDIRIALSKQYRHILVDEFQDTDEVQCAILFAIGAMQKAALWTNNMLRPGALFMVGDPKQAIYAFRGANVATYAKARDALVRQDSGATLHLTANFRSRPRILTHANECFAPAFVGVGQPEYVPLAPTRDAGNKPAVLKLTVDLPPQPGANEFKIADAIRLSEAEAVCSACMHLLKNYRIEDEDGARALRPGDIALLSPQATGLEIYEGVFADWGLPFGSLAGKGLYRRQEVQDVLALVRTLADPRDDVAFGALMRGPLVGLTDQELLNITTGLPGDQQSKRFCVTTTPEFIGHSIARGVVACLQDLQRRTRTTTPALLLGEAVDRLLVPAILAGREKHRWLQAVANIDEVIRRAGQYDVLGFKAFARDLQDDWARRNEWERRAEGKEGRVDGDGTVTIVSMHGAKGLEWPIVIPINMVTRSRRESEYVHRTDDNTLHWLIGRVASPELEGAMAFAADQARREHVRLWYVACTRARELFVVPNLLQADEQAWSRIVDLRCEQLEELELPANVGERATDTQQSGNQQTSAVFESEMAKIDGSSQPMIWRRASDGDSDRDAEVEAKVPDEQPALETVPVGGGRVRGLILHKLMEEVLSGECPEAPADLERRAVELVEQLVDKSNLDARPDAQEMSDKVCRTLAIPEIAATRAAFLPEIPVYAVLTGADGQRYSLAGRVDALANVQDTLIPFDWKSDINPTAEDVATHSAQLMDYLDATGAAKGALVYMTPSIVQWVTRRS